ncbi:MAG: [Fe-Fe] hydrogenase large subunit C-terminal domain-containing protein [Candidatus Hydrogenedentales bacterium]
MGGSIFHSVYLDSSLCVGCTTCVRRCPTQAIRVRDGKAHITEERCIDCGECIRACPKGAKKSVSDPLAVMGGYDINVALPAPSLYGQFGIDHSPEQVFAVLRTIGFDEVFDVAWGAKVLTESIREYAKADLPRPLISSACPVVVRLIQLRFPSLIQNLVPFLPPVEVAAREVRSRFARAGAAFANKRVGIFFLSPCTSKVTAIKAPLGYLSSEVNAVFSFQDIYAALKKNLKAASRASEDDRAGRPAALPRIRELGSGIGWARSDGELESLDIPGAVSVDGIGNVIALLEEIDNGKLGELPYIEALACPGGCVGGPMAVANPHVARTTIKAIAKKESAKSACPASEASAPPSGTLVQPSGTYVSPSGSAAPANFRPLLWDEELLPKPVMVLDRDMGKALAMAEALEEIATGLPGLDCGACGAPDCRAFAEDIVKGCAKIDDCIVRMKEKSAKIAGIPN